MKNKYTYGVFLILVLLSVNSIYAQTNGQATYSMKSIFSFNKTKNSDVNKALDIIAEESKNTNDIRFNLTFNKTEFLFSYEESLETDEDNGFNMALLFAKTVGDTYMNTVTNEILNEQELLDGRKVIIKTNLKDLNWKLVNEKKEIGKYTCYKAISIKKFKGRNGKDKERIFEAWYTPDIPINGGRIGLGGLPGLIIELKDGNNFIYNLLEISFNTKDIIKIEKPKKGKIITPKEYRKIKKEVKEAQNRN